MALALRRQRASLVRLAGPLVVLLAASGAACSAVLGLSAPTLEACADGCVDGSAPTTDTGLSSDDAPDTFDGVALPDTSVAADAEASVESPDAESDATDDPSIPDGIRCGPTALGLYCQASCCLSLVGDGGAGYACAASETDCENSSGFPIQCTSDNDCNGSEVCCFFSSKITCDSTSACASAPLLCDPNVPASDQCSSNQTCTSGNLTHEGYALPYDSCK